jgi:hypothetical protein
VEDGLINGVPSTGVASVIFSIPYVPECLYRVCPKDRPVPFPPWQSDLLGP